MIFRIRMLLIMMNIVHLYSRVTCSSLEKNAFMFSASSRRSASLVAALFSRGPLAPVSSSSDDMTTMVTWLIAAPEGPGQASRNALAAPQSAAGSLPRAPREASQSAAGSLPERCGKPSRSSFWVSQVSRQMQPTKVAQVGRQMRPTKLSRKVSQVGRQMRHTKHSG